MVRPPQSAAPFWLLPALALLLICSGVCALIYQVLWLRLLALTFGVTVHAAATVLSSFMGGLAVGSLLAGRLADRSPRPLRLFGAAELAIGALAAVSPFALSSLHRAFAAVSPYLPDSTFVLTIVRIVLSFAVLLLPTALMGATMPIVVRATRTTLESLGTKIGVLYACNTAGAIAGTVLAGFYLIPQMGLSRSFAIAAALNGFVGVSAIALSRLWNAESSLEPSGPDASAAATVMDSEGRSAAPVANTDRGVVLAVSAISGFASLALEVVWFRVLAIFLGPVSYTFTTVLAMVLTGIAIGSAVAAPLLRLRSLDWMQALAIMQFAGAALVLGSYAGLVAPPDLPPWLAAWFHDLGVGFTVPAVSMGLGAVLPAALFFGLSFPVALRLWTEQAGAADTGRSVGLFYSMNVAGGILGSLAAGFVLLPMLGSRTSLIFLAALYVIAGIGVQLTCARRRPFVTGLAVAGLAALVVQAQLVPDPLDLVSRRVYTGRPVLWQQEGMQTTVAVVGGAGRVMLIDGRHQANDSAEMAFIHHRIGLLPVVLHPRPRRALVVGLGGGATPGGMSQFPRLAVDVIELSAGVIEGSSYFGSINFDILKNPSVRIRLDDGRNFLQRVRVPYDVITADAIIPRHAGANNLNSVEYFRLVREALAPTGIALHWNGGTTGTEYSLILRAFAAAFPHVTLWGDGALMVGSQAPVTVSRQRIQDLLADAATRRALGLMHVESVEHLERMFRASDRDVRAFVGEGPVLSDDRPVLEYFESLPQDALDRSGLVRDPAPVFVP